MSSLLPGRGGVVPEGALLGDEGEEARRGAAGEVAARLPLGDGLLSSAQPVRELLLGQPEVPPQGLDARVAYDTSEYIASAIDEVVGTLTDTLVIVIVVIFLFLGSVRAVIIPVVAIPISLVGAVFLMLAAGFTVNLLTLLAIVLSVGLVAFTVIAVGFATWMLVPAITLAAAFAFAAVVAPTDAIAVTAIADAARGTTVTPTLMSAGSTVNTVPAAAG